MSELDFTIEFNGEGLSEAVESSMFDEADLRLRELADDHDDLTGAAINIRQPAHANTPYLYEATVVVYARPKNIASTEKDADPVIALKEALNAVERQVRKKREKLSKHWERPGNDPVAVEVEEIIASEDESQRS